MLPRHDNNAKLVFLCLVSLRCHIRRPAWSETLDKSEVDTNQLLQDRVPAKGALHSAKKLPRQRNTTTANRRNGKLQGARFPQNQPRRSDTTATKSWTDMVPELSTSIQVEGFGGSRRGHPLHSRTSDCPRHLHAPQLYFAGYGSLKATIICLTMTERPSCWSRRTPGR